MTDKSKEFTEGGNAFVAGKTFSDNPYDANHAGASRKAAYDWEGGWIDAEKQEIENMGGDKIVDIETREGRLVVVKKNDRYDVVVNGDVRHPNCNADSAIAALATYLLGAEHKLMTDAKFFATDVALRDFIAQEIRLAMQQERDGSVHGGLERAAVAEIRAGRILSKLDGHPLGSLTAVPRDGIDSARRQLLPQGD